jgi:hypothetical protein
MSSNRIIDGSSIFVGDDLGKDGIRKLVGSYFEIDENDQVGLVYNPNTDYIFSTDLPVIDETGLLPFYTQTLTFQTSSNVQDYDTWAAQLAITAIPGLEYIDHFCTQPSNQVSIQSLNNYEYFEYEQLSKVVPPLSLLNVYDTGDFPVTFDYGLPVKDIPFIDDFSINTSEAQRRQNMFFADDYISQPVEYTDVDENTGANIIINKIYTFNSYVKINVSDLSYGTPVQYGLQEIFVETRTVNKLFSYFKRTVGTGLNFYSDDLQTLAEVNVKGFLDFITNYDLVTFEQQADEKFYRDFNEPSTFEAQFLRLEMLSRVRDFVKTNIRKSYEQVIVDSDTCPTKVLGYKIEKYRLNGTSPLQTIFIMKNDFSSYYDTLFSYDTFYRYEIKQIVMVLGNSYSYNNIQEDKELGQVTLTFVNRPSLQFVELPVFTQDVIVTDIPNPPPEAMFFNERGNRNEIMITLDQATHVENSFPDNYPKYFINDYISQDKVFTQQQDTQIQFSTLYTSNIYEIYRVDYEPSSYTDFENNLLTIIGEAGVESTDNLFRDLVVPHKKYYYLIRTLTNFGIHSNPTRIYEAELIQDSDETYINYKEFKFPEIKLTRTEKPFKRFMQIKPTLAQLAFQPLDSSVDPSTYAASDIVGVEPEAIWGRRFKIRVTSKKTGKKIDLNVKFNLVDENNQPTN